VEVFHEEAGAKRPLDDYAQCLEDQTGDLVINSAAEYAGLDPRASTRGGCQAFTLPAMDFSGSTLLAKYASGSCGAGFERRIVRDDAAKTYIYSIAIRSITPICSGPPRASMNDVLIPKIPAGYSVVFEVEDRESGGTVNLLDGPRAGLEREQSIVESDTDVLGNYQKPQHARSYALLRERGLRVLNIPSEERYAAVWKPEGYASNRILVLLHGTAGAAYDGMKDELDMAEAYDLMLVGVQWHDDRTNTYDTGDKIYRRIDRVLRYLHETDGVPLTKVALSGFSRGGAMSYEVTWRDLQSNRYFDLTIAHSGGVHPDGVIAPRESNVPGVFLEKLLNDQLGPSPFAGSHFFLYAGMKDEQWDTRMAEYIAVARDLVTKGGGTVVECIIDPEGGHMGYLKNPEYHERSMKAFMQVLGDDPSPVRAVRKRTGEGPDGPPRRPLRGRRRR
jgi:predicted esterase